MTTSPVTARPRRPLRTIGWVLVALGVLVAAGSGVTLVVKIVNYVSHGLHEPTYPTPVNQQYRFHAGTYVVFERTGSASGVEGATTITPAQVTVTDDAGAVLSTGRPSGHQTITRDGEVYTGAVSFHVSHGGRYQVTVAADQPTKVFVERDLGSIALALVVWILLIAGGVVTIIVGVVLIVVDVARKRRGPPGVFTPVAFPAGWYPDPQFPGRSRWWDGQAWAP